MATINQTKTGNWKAVIRKAGWPTKSKTFRVKRDATDWARRTEDQMVRGVFIDRASSHRQKLSAVLDRYLSEVTPTKKPSTAVREKRRAKILKKYLGDYSVTALTPELIGQYRDKRIREGKSASSVRLELALLSHLFTIAIREWRLGLVGNPVSMVRKPAPPPGRNRRLKPKEEKRLLKACDAQSNPMLGWIVRLAIYTGMRQGEIESLTRDQVSFKSRVIKLTETKNGAARTVPLTKDAVKVLRKALDHPVRPIDTSLIFF
jgi:integrase